MSNDYESFKSKSLAILDLSFFTYLALIIIGGAFYFSLLPTNVQNTLPIILILFLGMFTWIIRMKLKDSSAEQYKEIKQIFIQWLVITVIFIVITIFIILIYPIS